MSNQNFVTVLLNDGIDSMAWLKYYKNGLISLGVHSGTQYFDYSNEFLCWNIVSKLNSLV